MDGIFISYSRRDKDFVTRLTAALKARNRKAWVDLTDIPATTKWWEKIEGGIEAARAFVFVLSPDSTVSPECQKEIEVATGAHKRLIPLVCRELGACAVHKDLACLNYIFCREEDDFEAAIETLLKAVDTDLEWVDAHTNLLQKAVEWDRKGRNQSLLLHGEELQEAEIWQAQSGAKEPKPTELMGEFILASRGAATQYKNKLIKGTVAVALVLAVIAVYAIWQRNIAITQQNIARSRELASTALNQLKIDPELAAVLSSKALDLAHTPQAEESLRHSLVKLFDSHVRIIMREPHKGSVRGAVFSPDDKLIVTACEDGKARVWDAKTGKFKFELAVKKGPGGQVPPGNLDTGYLRLLQRLLGLKNLVSPVQPGAPDPGVTKIVYSVDFSPDGRFIVTANANLQARVWDAKTGKLVFELAGERGHQGRVFSAAFCKNKAVKRIVTAGEDRKARVWDAETGKCLLVLAGEKGHKGWVRGAAFSSTGKRIVTASDDGTARVWNAETGEFLFEVGDARQHNGKLYKACFCPGDRLIATVGADYKARLWNAENGKFELELAGEKRHIGWIRDLAFDCDGNRIITAGQDQMVRVWDTKTGECLYVLAGHMGEVHSAAFNHDGSRLVTASGDQTARVWELGDFSKGIKILAEPHKDEVHCAAFSPDGRLIVTAGEDMTPRVWEAQTGNFLFELTGEKPHKGWVTSAAFSKDNKRIVTAGGDGRAKVWDVQTRTCLFDLAGEKGHRGWVYTAAFSSDNRLIVTAGEDRTAKVWDAETGKFLFELAGPRGHKSRVTSAAFSNDNKRIVTSGQDQTAKVWDVETKTCLLELAGEKGHRGWVYTAAFSSDDQRIVTAGEDQTARVWDAKTGKCLLILRGHKGWVSSAFFRAKNDRIVTAGEDKTARIWDAKTGELLVELPEHEAWVYTAAFSPSGNEIVTASQDKKVRIFGHEMCCSFKDLLDLARPLVMRQLTPAERQKFLHEAVSTEAVIWQKEYVAPKAGRSGMDFNIDRQGGDYDSFDLPITDPTLCQEQCDKDPQCQAWTYVKPHTVKGPRPKCFLKKAVSKTKPNPATVSGVKIPAEAKSP
jgi:WD40 repeat protein